MKPKFTPYVDALTEAMKICMDDPKMIFIGQQIVFYGKIYLYKIIFSKDYLHSSLI